MKRRSQLRSSSPGSVPGHDAELEHVMRGFFALSAKDQRRAFVQIRDFLGAAAPAETSADRAVAEQAEALDVLARVATHLNLPEGEVPTVNAFDAACRELQLPWTRSRVIRAWGRWRTACAAFSEREVPLTARQVAYHRRFRGRLTHHRPALDALRLFVQSNPPKERKQDYDRWVREQNDRLSENEPLFPTAQTALNRLRLTWIDALRVARGEVELADLPKRDGPHHESWVSGPHDLISIRFVMELFGIPRARAEGRAREEEFPTPVAIIGSTRGWLRGARWQGRT